MKITLMIVLLAAGCSSEAVQPTTDVCAQAAVAQGQVEQLQRDVDEGLANITAYEPNYVGDTIIALANARVKAKQLAEECNP